MGHHGWEIPGAPFLLAALLLMAAGMLALRVMSPLLEAQPDASCAAGDRIR